MNSLSSVPTVAVVWWFFCYTAALLLKQFAAAPRSAAHAGGVDFAGMLTPRFCMPPALLLRGREHCSMKGATK
jgi:hypothetical protein